MAKTPKQTADKQPESSKLDQAVYLLERSQQALETIGRYKFGKNDDSHELKEDIRVWVKALKTETTESLPED